MSVNLEFENITQSFEVEFTEVIDNTREPAIEPLTVTENGEYSPSENVDGFNPVKVAVPLRYDEGYNNGYNDGFAASQNSMKLQEKTATENGEVIADAGYVGLSKVNVAVPIKEEQTKTVDITENGTFEVVADEGKTLSKVTANVNVAFEGDIGKPYIDTSKITDFSYFCYNDTRDGFLNLLDTSNGTKFDYMFNNCKGLISIPLLDTSNGTSFNYMFGSCSNLTEIPLLDTSKGTSFNYMFFSCSKLTTIPQLDTSNGTNFTSMFRDCSSLQTIPAFDTSNGTTFSTMFYNCYALRTTPLLDTSNGTNFINMFYGCSNIETVSLTTAKSDLSTNTFQKCTDLKNITIGEGWAVSIYLHYSNNLTVESLHGMIENLADLTGKTAKTFQIGATNLAKIDEAHIAMLTAKNWIYQ